MSIVESHIAAVVLTHNSSDDLANVLISLKNQRGIDLQIVVVDNASSQQEREGMKKIFNNIFPDGIVQNSKTIKTSNTSPVFIFHDKNNGYTSGNNIGARFAVQSGCESVLIINPDVEIQNPKYIFNLNKLIKLNTQTVVACSCIINLEGSHENPMIELSFFEELFLPIRFFLGRFFKLKNHHIDFPNSEFNVKKVSGSCFLIAADFLKLIGFFDESTFLYCEEAILSVQVQQAGFKMVMDPKLRAFHNHKKDKKQDPSERFKLWAKSRGKFHKFYGPYGLMRRTLLLFSRSFLLTLIWIRKVFCSIYKKFSQ